MSEAQPNFISVVPKDTSLGRRLAAFTPLDLHLLRKDFERRFKVRIVIDDPEEPTVHFGAWFDFPRYEIAFNVQWLTQIREFEQLAFDTGTPAPE
jgi:hypothetical protein